MIELCLEGGGIGTVLDVGTGSGLFAQGFSERGNMVSGIDANPLMLTAARKFVPSGKYIQAAAEALPFCGGTYDLVFYGLVLHEADEPLKVLQSARRVSRKRVCIIEWPYRDQTFGPPLGDRLSAESLWSFFKQAGFTSWQQIGLANVDLYRVEI